MKSPAMSLICDQNLLHLKEPSRHWFFSVVLDYLGETACISGLLRPQPTVRSSALTIIIKTVTTIILISITYLKNFYLTN